MLRGLGGSALLAVVFGAGLCGSHALAQTSTDAGAVGSVPLPGGLRPLLAAIDDPVPADRSQFLLEFIRRAHNTPPTIKNTPRDALLRAALTHLERAGAAALTTNPETLPLPLSAKLWTEVVFKGRSSPQTLVADIIGSRDASLLYSGLLALDTSTRAWLTTERDLLGDLATRHAAAFVIAAPALRIAGSGVRVPGGEAALGVWEEIVGRSAREPSAFVRAVLSREDGHLAYFYASMAQLSEPQLRVAFNLESANPGDRIAAARRLFAVYERITESWTIAERAFWRPTVDPGLLLSDVNVDATGRPLLFGTQRFWTAVFEEADSGGARSTAAKPAALVTGEPLDYSRLCEQMFTADRIGDRRRGYAVLFASRVLPPLTATNAADALEAARAVINYPALVAALERAGLTSVHAFANAARRAALLSAIGDRDRAERVMAQYQGALALVVRAGWRGGLHPDDLAAQVSSLSAIEVDDRGDYEGRLAEWFVSWVASYLGDSPVDVYAEGAGPLETDAIAIAAGPPDSGRVVDWEGTRYRVNFARAEATRLANLLGEDSRPFLSTARTLIALARFLSASTIPRERLREEAENLEKIVAAVGCNKGEMWRGSDVARRCAEIVTALQRAARDGDARAASRLAAGLRNLADDMLARGLMELTYAVALGQRERALITADDGARRHDFGMGAVGLRRHVEWSFPIPSTDPRRGWHMMGSVLGLEVRLADFRLTRVSSRLPTRRPTLDDDRRRLLIEVAALIQPRSLADDARDAIVAALRKGRARVAALTNRESAQALADEIGLSPASGSLLSWVVANDRERLAAALSPTEVLWAGLERAPMPPTFHAWGGPAEPRLGCLCLQMIDRRPWETYAGRWHSGISASGFSDLNLRVTELLAEIAMPAALTAPVLSSATLELVEGATMRDHDDYRGLTEYVGSLRRARVEQYLALLTTDGPLVPLETEESR
ncbi:MAG: hypothetical protein WBC51_10545 [Vicinamibacterales bacterium]